MFDTLFSSEIALARHRTSPLAEERRRYLLHCAADGATRDTQRNRARAVLWVAERMAPEDVGRIGAPRLREMIQQHEPPLANRTAANLTNIVRPWLKYLGWWDQLKAPTPFAADLDRFVKWMRDERGLAPCTVEQWRYRSANFLAWCEQTGRSLGSLCPDDIDAYFLTYGAQR